MQSALIFWRALPATTRGIALMLTATVGFSLMHALVRHVAADLDPIQIAFFRSFFGLVVFLPWMLGSGLESLKTRRLPLHCLRAVMNVAAMFAFFTGLSLVPLAEVTALGFTAPIFAALLALFFLGERFRLRRWAAIAGAFLGTLVILRPGFQELALGQLLVLGSALLWAATLVVIKMLGRTESAVTITGYMNIMLSVLSLVPALLVWRWPSAESWGLLLLIGILGTLAQLGIAQALKEAEAGVVMPFDFLRLIWTAGLGYLFFAEIPDLFVWLGGALIFVSSSYLAYRESQIRRAERRDAVGPPG